MIEKNFGEISRKLIFLKIISLWNYSKNAQTTNSWAHKTMMNSKSLQTSHDSIMRSDLKMYKYFFPAPYVANNLDYI